MGLDYLIADTPTGTSDEHISTVQYLQKAASCPEALEVLVQADIFPTTGGGPQAMAEQYQVPYWGILPLDPNLLLSCEQGKVFVEEYPNSPAARALKGFCDRITSQLKVAEV